jgi:hypothetical protein
VTSPYEEVFGDTLDSLHPRLRAYFGEIPRGSIGMGAGVFDVVGTPRRWLWPVLRVLAAESIMFPEWQRGVPFTVVNTPIVDARGNTSVHAVRTFHFVSGDRQMIDTISAEPHSLVDRLGQARALIAALSATVVNGELRMTSTTLAVRIGCARIRIPRTIAPIVTLVERFDDATGLQHVSVVVDAPIIGRIYEYSGSFSYVLRPGKS